MHGAVEVHAGQAGHVRREDVLHHRGIGDVGGAFVVDDEIVALGVVGIGVGGKHGTRGFVGRVHVLDHNVGAGFEAVFENVLLRGVVVAATAGDEENAERFRRGRGGGESESGQGEEQSNDECAGGFHSERSMGNGWISGRRAGAEREPSEGMKSRGVEEIKVAGAAERLILNARITVGRVHVEDGAMAGSGRKVGLQNRIFF